MALIANPRKHEGCICVCVACTPVHTAKHLPIVLLYWQEIQLHYGQLRNCVIVHSMLLATLYWQRILPII
jgi:hypothetical protein